MLMNNIMSNDGVELNGGQLQDFTIDQAAGAFALALGAIGTLLLVVWQSRCLCKCRLGVSEACEIFYCERQPPPLEEDDDKDKDKDKKKDKKKKPAEVEELIIPDPEPLPEVPEPENIKIEILEPEPEPQAEG